MSWDQLQSTGFYQLHIATDGPIVANMERLMAERFGARLRDTKHLLGPIDGPGPSPKQVERATKAGLELRIQLSSTGNPPATHYGASGPLEGWAVLELQSILENLSSGNSAAIITLLDGTKFWDSAAGFGNGPATFADLLAMFAPPLVVIKPREQ